MTVIDDLKAAKAELINRGRCMGQMTRDGKVCALGAVGTVTVEHFEDLTSNDGQAFVALNTLERPRAVIAKLVEHLDNRKYEVMTDDIWRFNDRKTTTDADVLMLFEKALADLGGLG